MKTLVLTLVVMPLLAGTAGAESDPQFAPALAMLPIAGALTRAPTPSATHKPRLKLALTLSDPGPFSEAHGLRPSDSIIAPAETAAFEADDRHERSGDASR